VSIVSGWVSSRDGRGQCPGHSAPVSGVSGNVSHRAFRHVACHRSRAIEVLLTHPVGEKVDQPGDVGVRLVDEAWMTPASAAVARSRSLRGS
jgi:hypothetical protein